MRVTRAAKALALIALPGVGPVRRNERLEEYGSISAAVESFLEDQDEHARSLRRSLPECQVLVDRAQDAGLTVLDREDDGYPDLLRRAPLSPPLVLFVQGTLPDQIMGKEVSDVDSIAVVGTRSATREGLDEATALGRGLAASGVVVVSGLALGVDAAAHRGALSATTMSGVAAPTVAVLGGAHDRLHPKANAGLAARIVAGGGAVLSEYPPGVRPNRGSFLERNRIIAGLSRAVVVVEAGEQSGALSTATHAADAGLPVLTVPTRPSDRRRAGNLKLLRDGAAPLIDLSDVASVFPDRSLAGAALRASGGTDGQLDARRVVGARATYLPRSSGGLVDRDHDSGLAFAPGAVGVKRMADLEGLARTVLEVLHENGELSFDGLLVALSRTRPSTASSPSQLAGALVRLELRGAVRRGEDGRFSGTGPLFASGTLDVR